MLGSFVECFQVSQKVIFLLLCDILSLLLMTLMAFSRLSPNPLPPRPPLRLLRLGLGLTECSVSSSVLLNLLLLPSYLKSRLLWPILSPYPGSGDVLGLGLWNLASCTDPESRNIVSPDHFCPRSFFLRFDLLWSGGSLCPFELKKWNPSVSYPHPVYLPFVALLYFSTFYGYVGA